MPLDPAFVADCPYDETALFIDEVLSVEASTGKVVASMVVHDELPLTRAQRVHPVKHPRHVNGGLMVHLTGVVGLVHAYHVLGLRHADGWIGYGAKMHHARFHHLAVPRAEKLILEGWPTQNRRGAKRIMTRYSFHFHQAGRTVYEGDQTAMWLRVGEGDSIEVE
jgi:hypothetical protein